MDRINELERLIKERSIEIKEKQSKINTWKKELIEMVQMYKNSIENERKDIEHAELDMELLENERNKLMYKLGKY